MSEAIGALAPDEIDNPFHRGSWEVKTTPLDQQQQHA